MKKVNKVFYVTSTILEILLLIGTFVVNYFTRKRMGMLRHVVHKNYLWESEYPIIKLQYITIIAFIILMVLVLALYMKRMAKLKKFVLIMNIIMVGLVSIYVGFTLLYSTEKVKAFYYISFMLGIAVLIQIIKTFIGVLVYKNKE